MRKQALGRDFRLPALSLHVFSRSFRLRAPLCATREIMVFCTCRLTIVLVKIAAAKAHMTESAWTENAVLNELKRPPEKQEKRNPFDLP